MPLKIHTLDLTITQCIDYVVRIKNNIMTTNYRGFSAKV